MKNNDAMQCRNCRWGSSAWREGLVDCTFYPKKERKRAGDSCSKFSGDKCKNCFCGRVDKETMSNPFSLFGREFVDCPACGGTGFEIS